MFSPKIAITHCPPFCWHLFQTGEDPGPDEAAVVGLDRQETADAVRELGERDKGQLKHFHFC
jgi:hypothetical protein